ncbi:hypothetical protein [Vannielia litorea]|uniref:hypothetical protein n=1 Tax=Vannielia litorea TaxID=1217970 RepID=UPI001C96EB00|nr:hypothetical protein [Vannielia litorea]MBY6047594.1 hypothetical protein [Vannielia litorea]MBY6075008.1 hypothetical protein [Vannielia litorea]
MVDLAEMIFASIGLGGLAALWVLKAVLGIGALRLWRRWRNRRAVLATPEV